MESNWAAEHLQTIRTLMERSTLYRRALGPMMLTAGLFGILGATIPCFVAINSNRQFALYWIAVSLVTSAAAFYLARREAIKESEPFWSSPTRRVTQALLPSFSVGLIAGLFFVSSNAIPNCPGILASFWVITYGLGLHAAAFFTQQQGIRFFGWFFALTGSGLLTLSCLAPVLQAGESAHYIMGTAFGLLHLAYGIYLYFTEKRRQPL